jgi:2-desacetyl-2-hydroxyethyl bacteriochlorophyllide A dehydrogenase
MQPPRQTTAIVFPAPGQIELRRVDLPAPEPSDIVVQVARTGVSTGTELRVLAAKYVKPDAFPLVPGYCAVGTVTWVGPAAKGFRVGDRVSCRNPRPLPGIGCSWGGQCAWHVARTVGEDAAILLPEGNWDDYALAEVAAISHRGVLSADPRPGETAVVVGQGLIGAASAAWLAAAGCRVVAVDREPGRLALAKQWGAMATVEAGPDAAERILALTGGGADIVVESSGSTPGFNLARRLTRPLPHRSRTEWDVPDLSAPPRWARRVMQANYLEEVPLNPHGIAPGEGCVFLSPMDRGIADRLRTVAAIRAGRFPGRTLVQRVVPVAEAPSAYRRLLDNPADAFSLAFDWSGAE